MEVVPNSLRLVEPSNVCPGSGSAGRGTLPRATPLSREMLRTGSTGTGPTQGSFGDRVPRRRSVDVPRTGRRTALPALPDPQRSNTELRPSLYRGRRNAAQG